MFVEMLRIEKVCESTKILPHCLKGPLVHRGQAGGKTQLWAVF